MKQIIRHFITAKHCNMNKYHSISIRLYISLNLQPCFVSRKKLFSFVWSIQTLTFTILWANSATNLWYLLYFSQKLGWECHAKLSPLEIIWQNFHSLLSKKTKKIFQKVVYWNSYQTCLALIIKSILPLNNFNGFSGNTGHRFKLV